MSDVMARCRHLETLLHREVPLSETIGVTVNHYDGQSVGLHAALAPNINVHGIAFGGSIYSVCSLAGWGLLVLCLEDEGVDARIMLAGAEVRYLKPIRQAIDTSAGFASDNIFRSFVGVIGEKGKARIKVPVRVVLADGETAAEFVGDYIAFDRNA